MHNFSLGLDIGSTTVKTVLLDNGKEIFSRYERHRSNVRETVISQLRELCDSVGDILTGVCVTGSASLGFAQASDLPFCQEVFACSLAVGRDYPSADVVIELGGEDAKILFLTGGTEQRMNGACAGGTGAFIDQMATLLNASPEKFDRMALDYERIYPIASRCGVFAKSDIQPLINQGARLEDIMMSVFFAIAEQTFSGLAQGREIAGNILLLGGPLYYYKGLRHAFEIRLKEKAKTLICPDNAPVFVAYGAALKAEGEKKSFLSRIIQTVEKCTLSGENIYEEPLFSSKKEYEEFLQRHNSAKLPEGNIATYKGKAYLGIDAGSTTVKLVLTGENKELLYTSYDFSHGSPIEIIRKRLSEMYDRMNDSISIVSSCVTGYGEEMIKSAFGVDYGIVETVAHFTSARYLQPDVDFVIDIGGQDMKCFKIKNGMVESVMLNEACSSGCGSFLQTFAEALGYDVEQFAKLGLFAKKPVDLGSRCTVFMNSSVKQAQKAGASVEDISAGLSSSVVKNALYKVIRARSTEELGKNIVVQGGTFLNDAVLRAFEKETGLNVKRSASAPLMGAFGCALYAGEHGSLSTLISRSQLREFSYTSRETVCNGCTTHCRLNILSFPGGRKFVSGNRCSRPEGKTDKSAPDYYAEKLSRIYSPSPAPASGNGLKVGIPMCLSNYEQVFFWRPFFTALNMQPVLSSVSSRALYVKGQHTIPSDTVCYPAKLAHGHIADLLEKNVNFIFYPCETYNFDEHKSDNRYNCPVVAYYPELLAANIKNLSKTKFLMPYIDFGSGKTLAATLADCLRVFGVSKNEIKNALDYAFREFARQKDELHRLGRNILTDASATGKWTIVLAGRPYHIDPEINHGINKLLSEYGVAVIGEECVADIQPAVHVNVLDQWTYHSRLYRAARFVTQTPRTALVQLVSFGCGVDAITSDEVRSILESHGKPYTQIKIDEIANLGAARIRLRSLLAALGAE